MTISLLSSVRRADIRLDPFPHVVVPDALPAHVYARLSADCPGYRRVFCDIPFDRLPDNQRYALSAQLIRDGEDIAQSWKQFAEYHTSAAFLAELAALFEGHWPRQMLDALGGSLEGNSIGLHSYAKPGDWRIHMDSRIEINTPVRGAPSTPRGAHLDTTNRLYSGLYYLRSPEDDSEGGELILYRWRQPPSEPLDRYELPDEAVEVAAVIPYRANQLVLFPQTIGSIHGVGVRHPTEHIRRYVFITAEIDEPWLTLPEQR
jgi:hypothetical protein